MSWVNNYLKKVEKWEISISQYIDMVDTGVINPQEVILYLNTNVWKNIE